MVDRALAAHNAALAERVRLIPGLDVRLALIDPAKHQDEYHVLQGLEDPTTDSDAARFYALQRWGSTGSRGQCKMEGPLEKNEVAAILAKVFEERTGTAWGSMLPGDKTKPGKYWVQQASSPDMKATWEYYVGDGVDGKRDGWYPYTAGASDEVEEIYAQHEANQRESRTATRRVTSGHFAYLVDLNQLTQKNSRTGKVRQIRRVLGTEILCGPQGAPPQEGKKGAYGSRNHAALQQASSSGEVIQKCTSKPKSSRKAEAKSTKSVKKKAMKTAKATKATKTKKAIKAMIAKQASMMKAATKKTVSKVATGKRAWVQLMTGQKEKTRKGLRKSDLMRNKEGRIVSKKRSANGKINFTNIARWVAACKRARDELGLTGFVAIRKDSALYRRARELSAEGIVNSSNSHLV